MHHGFLSILPPVLAIALAIKTKQVYIALLAGLWCGYLILAGGNILEASLETINSLVEVFASTGSARTIFFTLLMGSLLHMMQASGGIRGFVTLIERWLAKRASDDLDHQRLIVQLMVMAVGMLLFIESSISILTSGTIFRPICQKLGIPKEKLAYLTDATSAPSSILIPLNAWGAYIMSLLLTQGFEKPLSVLFSAMLYNFYPILIILLSIVLIVKKTDYGAMKKTWKKQSDAHSEPEPKDNTEGKAINMILPLVVMVMLVPFFQVFTGWEDTISRTYTSLGARLFDAISRGSGSAAVLYAVVTAIAISMFLSLSQRKASIKNLMDQLLKGMEPMLSMAGLMVLAFAMGSLCKLLGTGTFVAAVTSEVVSPIVVPALVFIISSFIAFSTGTSWGTFAIMIPLVVPLAEATEANVYMAIAAVMGGGVFGDHCSPISDTTLLASMASGSDHINHVKTQLPYALTAGTGAVILYLIFGLFI